MSDPLTQTLLHDTGLFGHGQGYRRQQVWDVEHAMYAGWRRRVRLTVTKTFSEEFTSAEAEVWTGGWSEAVRIVGGDPRMRDLPRSQDVAGEPVTRLLDTLLAEAKDILR